MNTENRTILYPVAPPETFDLPLGNEPARDESPPDDTALEKSPQDASATARSPIHRKDLALDHFAHLIGGNITVTGANECASFDLTEVNEKPKSQYPGQKRMPFSLILRSPAGVVLGGDHYDLEHPDLGTIPYVLLTRTLAYPDQDPGAYYEIKFI